MTVIQWPLQPIVEEPREHTYERPKREIEPWELPYEVDVGVAMLEEFNDIDLNEDGSRLLARYFAIRLASDALTRHEDRNGLERQRSEIMAYLKPEHRRAGGSSALLALQSAPEWTSIQQLVEMAPEAEDEAILDQVTRIAHEAEANGHGVTAFTYHSVLWREALARDMWNRAADAARGMSRSAAMKGGKWSVRRWRRIGRLLDARWREALAEAENNEPAASGAGAGSGAERGG